jgi:queuine tRNA-ribosyltransferase
MPYLTVKNRKYKLPIYLPDATRGVVRALDFKILQALKIKGVVVNTVHLLDDLGPQFLRKIGGIKNFMRFGDLVVSDSGGWQIFSLFYRNLKQDFEFKDDNLDKKINDKGIIFPISKQQSKIFTPEESIKMQFEINSDIVICLDHFSDPKEKSKAKVKETVERTILWAKKCKKEYLAQIKKRKLNKKNRPLIFSVIQGANFRDLRKYCAQKLIKIGFDGYSFGGYPITKNGSLNLSLAKYIAELIPKNKYKFALGVGKPRDIAYCHSFGWQIFDCTLPTRDARHMRLYIFNKKPKTKKDLLKKEIHGFIYINRLKYKKDMQPISQDCDCFTCQNYSRAYLHHLFKIKENLAFRLATIHNLRVYTQTIELLQN